LFQDSKGAILNSSMICHLGVILNSRTTGNALPNPASVARADVIIHSAYIPKADGSAVIRDDIHVSGKFYTTNDGYRGYIELVRNERRKLMLNDLNAYIGIDITHEESEFASLISSNRSKLELVNSLTSAAKVYGYQGICFDLSTLDAAQISLGLSMIADVDDDFNVAIIIDADTSGITDTCSKLVTRNVQYICRCNNQDAVEGLESILSTTLGVMLLNEDMIFNDNIPLMYTDLNALALRFSTMSECVEQRPVYVNDLVEITDSSTSGGFVSVANQDLVSVRSASSIHDEAYESHSSSIVNFERIGQSIPRNVTDKIGLLTVNNLNVVLSVIDALLANQSSAPSPTPRSKVQQKKKAKPFDCFCYIAKRTLERDGVVLTRDQIQKHVKTCKARRPADWDRR